MAAKRVGLMALQMADLRADQMALHWAEKMEMTMADLRVGKMAG